jgi:hypothetical protein
MDKYYTSIISNDGFGSQYQKILQTYIYCKIHNINFAYNKFTRVEHNYTNDPEYVDKLENLINLKANIVNVNSEMNCEYLDYGTIVMKFFESNIDNCSDSEHMKFIKECYWQNKDRDFFKNNKLNIAIHIRRENSHDKGVAGERATTPNSYYLNIMNKIREKYNNKDLSFHIYSQGNISSFNDLSNNDVKFYLNNDLVDTFKGLVAANVLVTSPSSLSYVAALISDGEIYYKKFWHNPKKDWIVCN